MAVARSPHTTLGDRVRDGSSYGLLFLLLLASYLVVADAGTGRVANIVAVVLYLTVLELALRISKARATVRRAGVVAGAAGLVLVAAVGGSGQRTVAGVVHLVFMVLLVATIAAIIRRGLSYEEVRIEAIAGALCIYVLIGLTFASLYVVLNAFAHHPWLATNGHPASLNQTYYFSFTALTTVGFGDVVPVTNFGRTLSMIEAILSQVFLASVVALVVSRFGASRPRKGG